MADLNHLAQQVGAELTRSLRIQDPDFLGRFTPALLKTILATDWLRFTLHHEHAEIGGHQKSADPRLAAFSATYFPGELDAPEALSGVLSRLGIEAAVPEVQGILNGPVRQSLMSLYAAAFQAQYAGKIAPYLQRLIQLYPHLARTVAAAGADPSRARVQVVHARPASKGFFLEVDFTFLAPRPRISRIASRIAARRLASQGQPL